MEKKEKTKKITKSRSSTKLKKINSFAVPVYGVDGEVKKQTALLEGFLETKINPKLLAQYIRVYLANQRQGTASAKTRAEVSGSTRKIYRQKGTGKARHGDIKAPIFVGGGVVGGPSMRDYSLKINKKQKRKALLYSLILQLKEKNILSFSSEILNIEAKTKQVVNLLSKLGLFPMKILFILPKKLNKDNFTLAARNIPKVNLVSVENINPYLILAHKKIIIFEEAVDFLNKLFVKKNKNS